MTYLPCRGRTFLVASGPGPDQKHLFVLLTEKCPSDCHLAVCIQSVCPGEYYDETCLLREGDHSFISHLSWVAYHRAVILSHPHIIEAVSSFSYLIKEDATDDVLIRIGSGLLLSKRATRKIKTYYAANIVAGVELPSRKGAS